MFEKVREEVAKLDVSAAGAAPRQRFYPARLTISGVRAIKMLAIRYTLGHTSRLSPHIVEEIDKLYIEAIKEWLNTKGNKYGNRKLISSYCAFHMRQIQGELIESLVEELGKEKCDPELGPCCSKCGSKYLLCQHRCEKGRIYYEKTR